MKVGQVHNDVTAETLRLPGHRPARFWWGWALALTLTGLLLILATLPPFVDPGWRALLMQGFSTACHQIPERSPAVGGVSLAVCHRCYGVYWGLPLAALVFLGLARWGAFLNRYAGLILLGALIPTGIDWLLGALGLWHNTPLSRLTTGGVLGLITGYYLARALTQIFVPKRIPPPTGS